MYDIMQDSRWKDKEYCLKMVHKNAYNLAYVLCRDEEIWVEAVNRDPWAIQFIENPPKKIVEMALIKSPISLFFMKEQTPEFCVMAIKFGLDMKEYIKIPYEDWTDEMKEEWVLRHV